MIATTVTLAERPDLAAAVWSLENTWPAFLRAGPVGVLMERLGGAFPEHQVLALDGAGEVVGKVHAVPFRLEAMDDLPDRGWDAVLERGFAGREAGGARTPCRCSRPGSPRG